jgi:hypothetical protein
MSTKGQTLPSEGRSANDGSQAVSGFQGVDESRSSLGAVALDCSMRAGMPGAVLDTKTSPTKEVVAVGVHGTERVTSALMPNRDEHELNRLI